MSDAVQLLVFCVEGQRHALRLEAVERVTPAAEVTPLPGAPAAVLGAIDIGGRILPVFSMRRHLGQPDRALRLSDVLLIARTARRSVALLVDEVQAVRTAPATTVDAATIATGLGTVQGLVRLDDGLLLIHDLERFLSREDERILDAAMRQAA
jgi:purine-binding chemotaxis protein CheW